MIRLGECRCLHCNHSFEADEAIYTIQLPRKNVYKSEEESLDDFMTLEHLEDNDDVQDIWHNCVLRTAPFCGTIG